MTGRDAARVFYDPKRFRRAGASPVPLQKTLFGVGGVQWLDGEAHAARKALLLSLLSAERAEPLAEASARE